MATKQFTVVSGDTIKVTGSPVDFTAPEIPEGKVITALVVDGDVVSDGGAHEYPAGSAIIVQYGTRDETPAVVATATNPIANTSIVTDVILRVTHADGSTTDIGATEPYTFQNGDVLSVVATPYVAPKVTIALPTIPAGDVVTDFSLSGATQGQTAELTAGDSVSLDITTQEFAVDVTVDYTNTTEPEVTHADEASQTP